MSLANYFENVKGIGILGTANPEGKVDLAIYARPQVINEETVAFLMEDHLSHRNVAANPHAAYLFLEDTEGCNGLRMHLTRAAEETDPKRIEAIRRRSRVAEDFAAPNGFLVQFKVDEVRPLAKERSEASTLSAASAEL